MTDPLIIAPETVLKAYHLGIFPMALARESSEIHFYEPDMRGIIPLSPPHIPKRLLRTVKQKPFHIRYNTAFHEVITQCATLTTARDDTWINDAIITLYTSLHEMGHAHSVEVYDDMTLVGGLYGIRLGRVFFGESMFSRTPNASKIALTHLIARLHHGGFTLLDAQFGNDHLTQFGLFEIPKEEFQILLAEGKDGGQDGSDSDFHFEKTEDEMISHLLQAIKVTS